METGGLIILFALIGAGAGALHFFLLRRNVDLLVAGGSPLRAAAAILGRFALTVVIFLFAAMSHGVAVLWMLGGFVAARSAAVRLVRMGT
jgi:hypothetical protein